MFHQCIVIYQMKMAVVQKNGNADFIISGVITALCTIPVIHFFMNVLMNPVCLLSLLIKNKKINYG